MDLGATHHATLRDVFVTLQYRDFDAVKMENKNVSQITRIGNVHLETEMGWLLVLKDVRHVTGLCLNLISASKLDDICYNVNPDSEKLKLTKDLLTMARRSKCYSFYKLWGK